MNNQPSPLETLAAFAIVFAAGVVSTATLGTYIGYLRRKIDAGLDEPLLVTVTRYCFSRRRMICSGVSSGCDARIFST